MYYTQITMKKILFFLLILNGFQVFSQITLLKDIGFGNNGAFTMNFNPGQSILQSNTIVLKDHSILQIISVTDNDYILKLKPTGKLDENFAAQGILDLGSTNCLNAVLQADKIIVYFGPKSSDYSSYEDSKIVRYNSDGTLDTTFGNEGILNEVTETTNPQALSVLVLKDLSLIISNSSENHPKKYTKDGQLDQTFGNNGEISYDYHYPLGTDSTGRIATCDLGSLSSSIYSFFDIEDISAHQVLNLNEKPCHSYNGVLLQNKTNLSTRMNDDGVVYSIFEYKNYPILDFCRLVVLKNNDLYSNFNGSGFVTSEFEQQFLDSGFSDETFLVLSQKENRKALVAFSAKGNSLKINNQNEFELLSGEEIEMKDQYLYINSILPKVEQNLAQVKIEKFSVQKEKLSTISLSPKKITVENPIKENLNIKNAENAQNFELYSLDGNKVFSSKNFKTMDTSNLPKGNYILKIEMKDG